MIKCEKGTVTINGNVPSVLSELSMIVDSTYRSFKSACIPEGDVLEMINKAVETGIEVDAEFKHKAYEPKGRLKDVLDEIVGILTGKDDE